MSGDSTPSRFQWLRDRAEELLKEPEGTGSDRFSNMDVLQLIHELEVHQIELQIQNEELREAKRQLEESRKEYADLYDLAPVGYVTISAKGIVVKANLAASDLLGLPKSRLIGQGGSSFVHPDDHGNYFLLTRKAAEGKSARLTGEIRLLRAGTEPFHARVEVVTSRDGGGRFNGWLITFGDISERRQMEEELRESHDELELRVEERTAELELKNKALTEYAVRLEDLNNELQEFAYVASHDLQEPVRKIQSFGNMLSSQYGDVLGERGRDYFKRMTDAAYRMSELLQSLLVYSRVTTRTTPFEPVRLKSVVEDAISDLEVTVMKSGATVEIGELPTIEGDAPQMRQLFQNLIGNSIKYRKESEKPLVRIHGKVEEGVHDMCRVFVEDNGIGFDEIYVDRIFKPFQRLHGRSAPYEGTGMGLAICRKIVERHGGTITAVSRLGKGAAFIIRLPLEQPKPET